MAALLEAFAARARGAPSPGFGKNGSAYQDTIAYTWDGGNRVTQAVDSIAGSIARTYDGLNHLTQETTPQGTVGYSYDNGGRRASMQVAGEGQVGYSWDNANRLTGVTQGSAGVGMSYDNANRRSCLTLPNGVIVSYAYDADSRASALSYGTGGSCASPPGNLGNLTYTYDAGGRRTARGGSLATVTLPGNVAGGSSTAYNADNEQTAFNGTSLSYDNNGNLTGDGTNTYSWDARNHLSAISQGRTTVGSFVYDGFGRRMKKTISGVTTQFLYDGLNPVQELDGASPPNVTANLLTGLGIDERFTRTDASGARDFMSDTLGSTLALADSTGVLQTQYIGRISAAVRREERRPPAAALQS